MVALNVNQFVRAATEEEEVFTGGRDVAYQVVGVGRAAQELSAELLEVQPVAKYDDVVRARVRDVLKDYAEGALVHKGALSIREYYGSFHQSRPFQVTV